MRNARPRWVSTVFSVTNSVWAISRLVPPAAASSATRRSLGVSESAPSRSVAPGPDADRGELGSRPALQSARAPHRDGQRQRLEQRLTRRGALSGGPERRAEVDAARARARGARRRRRKHLERRLQAAPRARSGGPTSACARSAIPIARGAPNACARRTSSAASARASSWRPSSASESAAAERHGEHGRVLAAERGVLERAAAQLLDRGLMVAGRGAQHAGCVAKLRARQELGVVADPGAVDQPAQRFRGLVAVEPRQHRRRHREDDELGAEQVRAQLDRGLGVRLGGGQVAAASGDQRPQRRDGHDRQRRAAARAPARGSRPSPAARRRSSSASGQRRQRQDRPVLAAVRLEREAGRERALGADPSPWPPSAGTSPRPSRASRAWSPAARRAPGRPGRAAAAIIGSSASRRADAEV